MLQAKTTSLPQQTGLLGKVIQRADKPVGARGPVSYYQQAGSERATDGRSHWYRNHWGTWTKLRMRQVPSYNRVRPASEGRGGERKASYKIREGSLASYAETKHRVKAEEIHVSLDHEVKVAPKKKRAYVTNMLNATTVEGLCATDSATVYAAHFHAPVIAGGYNWCHLIGHGAGGSDAASNIMAASTHCNSEQLLIEKVVYLYKAKGVSLRCQVRRHGGALYLASAFRYDVLVNGVVVYRREMDGFRNNKPSSVELSKVRDDLTKAITTALS